MAARTEISAVLHGYLQAVGAAKWVEANAFWAYQRLPDARAEGGLRERMPVRALRIRNRSPIPVGTPSPPTRVRVPVRLDLNSVDQQPYHYEGEYTLRRNEVTRRWELVDASLKSVPAR